MGVPPQESGTQQRIAEVMRQGFWKMTDKRIREDNCQPGVAASADRDQFAVRADPQCAAGVHVLASPMDPRSADVRFYDSQGIQLDKRAERKLENLFFREDFRRVGFHEIGDIEYASPRVDYVTHLLSTIDVEVLREARLRLLIDYDYSAASLVLLVGFSRIALGAHFLTDVLAAIIFGVTWLMVCMIAGKPMRRRTARSQSVIPLPDGSEALLAPVEQRALPVRISEAN